METKQGLPIIAFPDQPAWEDWLEQHHSDQPGAWVKLAKKNAPVPTVTFSEALESALCYGWIDGQISRYDEHHYLQRFTPRKPRSKWSKINREKAERLIADGRMAPAGLREVEAARADGRWDAAYEGQAAATVPPDLARALEANPAARAFFDTLTGVNRYAILYRIADAKRPETRERRIAKFVQMLAERTTIYP
jgi:uncharacterized protein YdeI (YjbR/CyaY-like superfamily)